MKNILFLLFISTLTASSLWAQQVIEKPQLYKRSSPYERYSTYRVSLSGGLALPMGSFKNYMAANSFHNYSVSLDLVFPQNNLSVGASIGSQYFQNRLPRQVFEFDNGAVSAVQTRTFSAYPIVLTGSYHLAKVTAQVRPYVQVGAGGAFTELINYWGSLPTGDNGFKMLVQGGAGVRALLNKTGHFGLEAGVTYQYMPFNFEAENIKEVSSLNARVGVFYRWW
jgi:hypothetical protein